MTLAVGQVAIGKITVRMKVEVPVSVKPVTLACPAVAWLSQKRGIDSARIVAHIPVATRAVASSVLLDKGSLVRGFGKEFERVCIYELDQVSALPAILKHEPTRQVDTL